MKYTSKHIEQAVDAMCMLPSIGKKTALRLVLYLLKQDSSKSEQIASAISRLAKEVKTCRQCSAYADEDLCHLCQDPHRDHKTICIVENVRDLMAIEETGHFRGMYHVLQGLISPLEGRGPQDLTLASLLKRVQNEPIEELILAIPSSIDGETTGYYIAHMVKDLPVKISVISRGVSFASDLEYADEVTLGRSILARVPYQQQVNAF